MILAGSQRAIDANGIVMFDAAAGAGAVSMKSASTAAPGAAELIGVNRWLQMTSPPISEPNDSQPGNVPFPNETIASMMAVAVGVVTAAVSRTVTKIGTSVGRSKRMVFVKPWLSMMLTATAP